MKFTRFAQAHASITLPAIGEMPFAIVDKEVGLVCVELTDREILQIRQNNNRVYIFVPLVPPFKDRPVSVTVSAKDPFITPMQVHGKEQKD